MKQITNHKTNTKTITKFRFFHALQAISITFLLANTIFLLHNNETKNILTYTLTGIITLLYPVFIYIFIQQYKNSVAPKYQSNSVDPIAEANVYLAYGRKEQAATILQEALTSDPENEKILEKLRSIEKA